MDDTMPEGPSPGQYTTFLMEEDENTPPPAQPVRLRSGLCRATAASRALSSAWRLRDASARACPA